MSWCACIINEKVLVDGRHMVRVLKTEAEGSMVFLTELSLPGFTFFCVMGLRFLPNDTLRAEGAFVFCILMEIL